VVDGRLRAHPSGCLRQSISLRSVVLPRFARPAGNLRLAISAALRFRRVHVVPEFIGSEPEVAFQAPRDGFAFGVRATAPCGGLEAEVGGGIGLGAGGLGFGGAGHGSG
jgi:hypothetical protein